MRKTALLFPGQGSQYVGMGEKLRNEWPVARQTFEEASQVLGYDLAKVCTEGSARELTQTCYAQPAILAVSVAAYRVYAAQSDRLPFPQYMAGHSLGEYTALACAGALPFGKAVRIVQKRGLLMQQAAEAGAGAMLAINGLDAAKVEEACAEAARDGMVAAIAALNAPQQVVVSGHQTAVGRVQRQCVRWGASTLPLQVSAPFHCALMQPAADQLRQELAAVEFRAARCKVIANATGLPYAGPGEVAGLLTAQFTRPVRWYDTMQYLLGQGVHYFVELGPRKVLRNLARHLDAGAEAYAFDEPRDVETLRGSVRENVRRIPTLVTRCLAQAVCAANANWNREEYRQGVTDPLGTLKQLQETLEREGRLPGPGEMESAMAILRQVLRTKRTARPEQERRLAAAAAELPPAHDAWLAGTLVNEPIL